jgi:hypothetical protein
MVRGLRRINISVYVQNGKRDIVYINHLDQKIGSAKPWELCTGDTFTHPKESKIIYRSSLSEKNFVREMKHLEKRYNLENLNSTFSEYVLNLLIKPKKGELVSIRKTLPAHINPINSPIITATPPITLEDVCSSCPFGKNTTSYGKEIIN